MTTEEALRNVFASHDRDGPLAIETWVGTWWPWLVLAASTAFVIVGGILYSS